jgi:hypothetical protein
MPGEPLSPEVRQFLARHIASVEELEILLLLHRESASSWNAETVYQVIKSSRDSVQRGLDKFHSAGLLVASTPPAYALHPSATGAALDGLARAYRDMPVRVVEAIYQRPSDSAQDFADAFKIKRES